MDDSQPWEITVVPSDGSPPTTTSGVRQVALETEHMTDVVTPKFNKLKRDGHIVLNPMSHRKERHMFGDIPVTRYIGPEDGKNNGWSSTGDFAEIFRTDANCPGYLVNSMGRHINDDLTMLEAISNIDSNKTQVLVTLAEMNKTLGLVRDTVDASRGLGRSFSGVLKAHGISPKSTMSGLRRKRRIQKKAVKAISNAWLTYRYGMRPVVFDVKNILSSLASKPAIRFTASATSSFSNTDMDTASFSSNKMTVNISRRTSMNVEVRSGILCEVPNPFSRTVQHWGLDDVSEAAWELVPYSFVADWFINIGLLFDALPPELGVDVKGWWTVNRMNNLSQRDYSFGGFDPTWRPTSSKSGSFSGFDNKYVVDTVRTGGYGAPSVSALSAFKLKNELNISKVVDIFALASKFL